MRSVLRATVIVSIFSTERLGELLNCVKSLRLQSLPPEEILLVLDPGKELLEFYRSKFPSGVKIIVSGKKGLSNARNVGIKTARSDIVAFIDDDAFAEIDWLEKLVNTYDNLFVVSVGGMIKPDWGGIRPKWFPEELDWILGCSYRGLPEKKASVRNAIGCNMSFRRKIFDEVGYFRNDVGRFGKHLLGSEEPELSARIFEKIPKAKIVYNPEAVVHHKVSKGRKTLWYLWKRSFYEGLSKALLISSRRESGKTLATEDKYLKYLMTSAIPSRLKKFYNLRSLSQLTILSLSLVAVFSGFASGKILQRSGN